MELRRATGVRELLTRFNDLVDVVLGNRGGRIRLWGGSGTKKNIRGGATLSSNVHALIVRDDGGFHVLVRNSGDSADLFAVEDTAGVRVSDLLASGNLKWKSGTSFTVTLDHAATADRTVTFQDLAGTAALLGAANAGNLLFVDATHDIGASGATRPRDLFLSRNAVIGGTLQVVGVTTHNASVIFSADATHDIGASGATRPRDLFLSRTATIGTSIIVPTVGPASGQQHTLPAVTSDTVTLNAATQTLTNKTITSPTMSGTWAAPAADPPTVDGQVTNESQCKGYVQVYVVGGAVFPSHSYNVASVTYNGAGDYSVAWNRDFTNEGYVALVTMEGGTPLIAHVNSKVASSVDIHVETEAGVMTDPDAFGVAAFGTLS